MKAIRRLLAPAALFSAALTLAAANVAAQNPCDDREGILALDAKIRANYPMVNTSSVAVEAAKEYLKKYGECVDVKDFVGWLKSNVPKWEHNGPDGPTAKLRKFDDALKAKNLDGIYAIGKELLQIYPDNVNFMLPMALIGLPETYKKNYKYNDESIKYAKLALARLKSGTAEPKKDKDGKPILDAGKNPVYGPFQFERNAEAAISELTYGLGYILYHAKNDKRAGLLYLYEASQLPGMYKTEPQLYFTIGRYYAEQSAPIGKEVVALIEKQKLAQTDEEKAKLEVEIKAKAALFNGYLARELDAFSRAYRFADEKIPSEKALKTQLYAKLAGSIGPEAKGRLDKLVAESAQKPLPDPTTAVTPIEEPDPVQPPSAELAPKAKGKPRPPAARKRRP